MPIRTETVTDTDGVISEARTFLPQPRTPQEVRENVKAIRAYVNGHNLLETFDGRVADLERVCLRARSNRPAVPVFGSRAWYASEILLTIRDVREALANGNAQQAASQSVVVGTLAAQAEARHHWPIVQLGIKNRESIKRAARARGKIITGEASALRRSIRQVIDRLKAGDERITRRKLAQALQVNVRTIQRHLKEMGVTIPA